MILQVEGVSFVYPAHPVLDDVNFAVAENDCIAILGTNGTGKSTLLKCINRILTPRGGSVYLNGKDCGDLSHREIAKNIGYVAQNHTTAKITVFDSVLLGRKPYIGWNATEADLEIVGQILEELSLSAYALRYTDELSGGELQKVVIARALAQQPRLFLLDEPTSSLDIRNQLETIAAVKQIMKKQNIAAIVTMHDINLALRFANRFLLMKDGRIYAVGGKEIITPENMAAVYGVTAIVYELDGDLVVVAKDRHDTSTGKEN